jgi:diphosphomevalonate decarboxylase
MSRILAQAPANIALIKYMGKQDARSNLPANASLSMTLHSLSTWVEIAREPDSRFASHWVAAVPEGAPRSARVPELTSAAIARFTAHLERVRAWTLDALPGFGLSVRPDGRFALRSANTFPTASGIASSASSFAALTLAGAAAFSADVGRFSEALNGELRLRRELARLSRLGSGSSCRSFEGPWVNWEGEDAAGLDAPGMPEMTDLILVVASGPKEVSSSEAHARVKSSPLWEDRAERANARARDLEAALAEGDLSRLARIAWAETWEMHSLFHTSAEPFTYWQPGTLEALRWIAPAVLSQGDLRAPIVTLDAGPNVHFVVPSADSGEWKRRIRERFPSCELLEDVQGRGARIVEFREHA